MGSVYGSHGVCSSTKKINFVLIIMSFFPDFLILLPQFFVAVAVLSGLTLFSGYGGLNRSSGRLLVHQAGAFLVLTLLCSLLLLLPIFSLTFFGLFSSLVFSPFVSSYALLAVLAAVASLLLYMGYSSYSDLNQFEIPFFLVFATLATLVIFFSNDYLVAYLGLEFQALVLYVLAASRVNSTYSTEAGLKYFVLGSFASCLMLLGISFLYGATGLLNFTDFSLFFASPGFSQEQRQACVLAFLLIVLGLLFKVGAAPFHFWVPDVYTGSSVVVTAFFATLPKLAAWVFLLKLAVSSLYTFVDFFANFFVFSGLFSLVVGAYGAVSQTSLKRILAFSAIAHTGYLLLGLAAFQTSGIISNFVYLFVYLLSIFPIFCLISFYFPAFISSTAIDSVYGLRYLYKHNRTAGLLLVLSLFSLSGIPPFSGFFAKLYVFFSLLSAGYVYTAAFALFLSTASAVYYLKSVRFAYFFRDSRGFLLFNEISRFGAYMVSLFFVLNVSFVLWGSDLLVLLCQFQSNFVL